MKTRAGGRNFYFLITESSFQKLKEKVRHYNRKREKGQPRLKFDIACFFLHYFTYKVASTKDKEQFGYIRLCSSILQKLHKEYNAYRDFLVVHGFIKVDRTYSTAKNECMRYKVAFPKKQIKMISYSPKDFVLRKKVKDLSKIQQENADKRVIHLTKWLNPEYLDTDYENCLKYIHNVKMKGSEKYHRRFLLETIHQGVYGYSRKGLDDRLHTPLTNLPKDLRCFLRHKGEPLVSMDIKTSQPYILAGLINLLYIVKEQDKVNKCVQVIRNIRIRNSIGSIITTMLVKEVGDPMLAELKQFIKLVTDGDIYEYIGHNFSEKFLYDIQTPLGISDKFYNKTKEYKEVIHFATLRDYCKRAMLEYLYCSPNSKETRNKEIRRILPTVISELIDALKGEDKSHFPIFLQNLEAYLVLDRITKRIAQEKPDAPLYTIHDSVASTEEHVGLVRTSLKEGLTNFFGIIPKIETEHWGDKSSEAA